MTTSPTTAAPNRNLVLTGAVISLLAGGALYAFSVFAMPFAAKNGWAMPQVMFAFSLTSMLAPVVMIGSGLLVDRGYAKWLMVAGGILYGLGYVIAGTATSLTVFYLGFGLVTGVGQGMMYAAALNNTMKFFPDKRGFASGMITGGMGAGSALFAPLGRWLISSTGAPIQAGDLPPTNDPTQAFITLGIIFAILVVVVGLLFIRACPPGYAPAGWTPPATAGGRPGGFRQVDWKGMLASPQFWVILPMFIAGAFFGLMITANLSPLSQSMFAQTPATAAIYVSLLAVFNAIGRITWGLISDKIGPINSLVGVFIIAALALVLLGSASGVAVLTIGVIVLGFAFGGVMSLFPPLTMSNYGPKNQGVNYGIVFSAYALSGLVAPAWASGIAGESGDFSTAFYIAAGIALVGLALTFVYRVIDKARPVQGKPADEVQTDASAA